MHGMLMTEGAKLTFYKVTSFPKFLYGSEIWAKKNKNVSKIQIE